MQKSKVLLTFSAMVMAAGVTGCAGNQNNQDIQDTPETFRAEDNYMEELYASPEETVASMPETEGETILTETESEPGEKTTEPVYVLQDDDYLANSMVTLYGPPEVFDRVDP